MKTTFKEETIQSGKIEIPVHLACADDELRPVMNHVLVTKKHIVASDAHILVRHETDSIFTDAFISGFPSDRFLIHSSAWQKLTEQQVLRFGWSMNDPDCILIEYTNKRHYTLSIRVKYEGSMNKGVFDNGIGKYPAYQAVIPSPDKTHPFDQIPFRPDFLDRLFKSMTKPEDRQHGCSLFPTEHGTPDENVLHCAITVRANSVEADHVVGVIMPVMTNGCDDLRKW